MTDLRPRPPRIQSGEYADYATKHQRICVWKPVANGKWRVEDHRRGNFPFADIFPTFAEAWAHVNHLLKETK